MSDANYEAVDRAQRCDAALAEVGWAFDKITSELTAMLLATDAMATDKRETLYHQIRALSAVRTVMVRSVALGKVSLSILDADQGSEDLS